MASRSSTTIGPRKSEPCISAVTRLNWAEGSSNLNRGPLEGRHRTEQQYQAQTRSSSCTSREIPLAVGLVEQRACCRNDANSTVVSPTILSYIAACWIAEHRSIAARLSRVEERPHLLEMSRAVDQEAPK